MNLQEVEIQTSNLLLKPIEFKYNKNILEEFSHEIAKYKLPTPDEGIKGVNKFIELSIGGLQNGSNLQLVILHRFTLEFIGCVGLHNVDKKDPELGLWTKKSSHGNGYGLEAITELIKWAKLNLDFEYLKYSVDKRNFSSKRILENNGGIIKREYTSLNQNGFELDEVEYWIYK